MHRGSINSDSFFCCYVWAIFKVVVLPLLLCFEVKTRQSSQVLFAYCLVNRSSSSDSFSIVVGRIRPPVSLRFHVADYHVLYLSR